jgi:peptidoglycan/xylan/chitin deacetylase (PgdA/CDA1 family)
VSSTDPLSVCLSFDCDTIAVWPTAFDLNSSTMRSRGEFGAFAMPRILDLLDRHGVRATFFVPGFTALAYPTVVRELHRRGHELAHHGWMHENPSAFDLARQRELLAKGIDALERVAGVRPIGYRAPGGQTDDPADLLLELGFVYLATYSATDFSAYHLRQGDRWSPTEPYVFGTDSELVVVPFNHSLNDFPNLEFVPGWTPTVLPPSAVLEAWQAEFDWACANCPGGVFFVTMHPQVIGRGSRLAMLDRLVAHMASRGVVFESAGDYATRWRAARTAARSRSVSPASTS